MREKCISREDFYPSQKSQKARKSYSCRASEPFNTNSVYRFHRHGGVHGNSCPHVNTRMSDYISLRNISSNCARLAGRGLPGAQASAAADWHRNGRSSSLSFSNLVGMPTSTDN